MEAKTSMNMLQYLQPSLLKAVPQKAV